MVMQKGKSSILAKLGNQLNKAIAAHKDDELELSQFGELPAGIENGIAQLVECKFDVYKKGDMKDQPFFYAAGVVKRPETVGDIPIKGLRTSIMEPVCDTPGKARQTVDEHIKKIMNDMRKLGYDTSTIKSHHDLESAAEE